VKNLQTAILHLVLLYLLRIPVCVCSYDWQCSVNSGRWTADSTGGRPGRRLDACEKFRRWQRVCPDIIRPLQLVCSSAYVSSRMIARNHVIDHVTVHTVYDHSCTFWTSVASAEVTSLSSLVPSGDNRYLCSCIILKCRHGMNVYVLKRHSAALFCISAAL